MLLKIHCATTESHSYFKRHWLLRICRGATTAVAWGAGPPAVVVVAAAACRFYSDTLSDGVHTPAALAPAKGLAAALPAKGLAAAGDLAAAALPDQDTPA